MQGWTREIVEFFTKFNNKTKFDKAFSFINARRVARIIVEKFEQASNDQLKNSENSIELDFSFNISAQHEGAMVEDQSSNVSLKFDDNQATLITDFINVMADAKDEEITDEVRDKFQTFLHEIKALLQNKYKHRIRNKMLLLLNMTKEIMPMNTILVKEVEINDLPENESTITLIRGRTVEEMEQMAMQPVNPPSTDSSNGNTEDVKYPSASAKLFKETAETGENPVTYVKRKIEEKDPLFSDVVGVNVEKAFYECNVDFYIDFSLNRPNKQSTNNSLELD